MENREHRVDGLRTADLVDAMGRMHRHRCHILDLASPAPDRVLFGRAVTISFFPACDEQFDPERFTFERLFDEAVGSEAAGKVLVLASNGYPDVSLGGGVKMSRVQQRKMAGILADGRLRDFRELAQYDFATYCTGEATHWGGDTVIPFAANLPVVVAGIGIMPGSFVFADASGAVVIPEPQIEAVLAEAANVQAEDVEAKAEIRDDAG